MKKILVMVVMAVFLVSVGQALGEEAKKKEKDIPALSYLGGYKCYKTLTDRKVMFRNRLTFAEAYKVGFADGLAINISESAFDEGFNDASSNYPSKYKEDILKE